LRKISTKNILFSNIPLSIIEVNGMLGIGYRMLRVSDREGYKMTGERVRSFSFLPRISANLTVEEKK